MDFLQSGIWRQIQTIVGRDIVDIAVDDEHYRGVRRSRSLGPITISWLQFLGIETMDQTQHIVQALDSMKSWGDVFVQIGVAGELSSYDLSDKPSSQQLIRTRQESDVSWSERGFRPSRKENMPLATVCTPLADAEDMMASMHKDHRRYLRKARKQGWSLTVADGTYDDAFYDVWTSVGLTKGIGVMTREAYHAVLAYLREEGVGDLFVLIDDGGNVIAGSIVAYHEDAMIYVYGGVDRTYGNQGAHILLQYLIMCEGYERGYKRFDHRGVAPGGYPEHHLAGVSRFKQRFGGVQKEFVGNMDYVHNPLLYKAMKWKLGK